MPDIYACADVHAGNHRVHGGELHVGMNDRCRSVLAVLRLAAAEAQIRGGLLVVAGDLVDVVRPEPQILTELQEIFKLVRTIVIKGNHESVSDTPGDHALGPLASVATVVDQPAAFVLGEGDDRTNLLCVPFQSGPAKDWLPLVVHTLAENLYSLDEYDDASPTVLVVHLGIEDKGTAPFLKGADDSIKVDALMHLCRDYSIDHVLAGNWHDRRHWIEETAQGHDTTVQQIGALVPTGWDNPGLKGYGGLAEFSRAVWEAGDAQKVHELPGPRFVKLYGGLEDAIKVVEKASNPKQLYMRITTDPEHVSTITDHFELLQNTGEIAAVSVVAAAAYREAAAATAASNARSASTLDGSLEGYVKRMPLPDDLVFGEPATEDTFRAAVLQAARDVLVEAMTGE